MRIASLILLATFSTAASAAPSPDPRLNGAYKFNEGGWTYVHLAGTPEQVGYQHGYILAKEIEDNVSVYKVTSVKVDKKPWDFFREAGRSILWPKLDPEYQAELKGIAEGLKAQGSTLDLWGRARPEWGSGTEQLLSAMAECKAKQAQPSEGGGAGQVQRFHCYRFSHQGR